jgi:hypothetical protein
MGYKDIVTDDRGYNKTGEMINMDFPDALKACINGKKIRRPHWGKSVDLSELQTLNPMDSLCDILADDWEVIEDIPEVNSDKVLSEFRTWLTKAISDSHRMSPYGYLYLVRCLDKLDELSSSKPARVRTPEKCTISIDGDEGIVTTESGESIIVHIL